MKKQRLEISDVILRYLLLFDCILFILIAPFSRLIVKITLGAGIVIVLLMSILRYKKKFLSAFLRLNVMNKYLIFFLVSASLSTLFSQNLVHSHKILFERYLYYYLFFLLGSFVIKEKQSVPVLTWTIIFVGIFIGIGAVNDYIHLKTNERLFSSFGNNINITPYLLLYIPFSYMIFVFAKNKFLRLSAVICTFLLFFCLIWNGSRIALLSVPVSILFLLLFKSKKLVWFSVFFFLILSIIPFYYKGNKIKSFFSISSWNRVELWNGAIKMFVKNPIIGSGPGTYEKSSNRDRYGDIHLHAHNTYLEIASEMGIIGLGTFLGIFFVFFKLFFRKIREEAFQSENSIMFLGLSSSILSILILASAASVITVGIQDSAVFWFIFGITSAFLKVTIRNDSFG